MNMDWISTPFVIFAFTGFVIFAISCAFCFLLGRLMGKLDGRDTPGTGRRTGAPDRRGPQRAGAADRGREAPTIETSVREAPALEQTSTG